MSLLERFGIVFDSNAVDATKDNEKLAKSFDDVEKSANTATKGTESNTKAVTEGNQALGKKSLTLGTLTRRFLGVAAAIKIASGTFKTLNATAAAGRFSEIIGQDLQTVEAISEASSRLGGSKPAAKAAIANLVTGIQGLKFGERTELFLQLQRAGSSVFNDDGTKKTILEIFREVADTFSTVEDAAFRGQQLGLPAGMIKLLMTGSANFDKQLALSKELGVTTDEQYRNAQELAVEMNKVGQLWQTIIREGIDELAPALLEAAKGFLEFSKSVRFLLGEGEDADISGFLKDSINRGLQDLVDFNKERQEKPLEQRQNETIDFLNRIQPDWLRNLQQKAIGRNRVIDSGRVPLGPGGSSAVNSDNRQSSTSIKVDNINVDAGGNANAVDIAKNIGTELQSLAAVNAQYSSGILA